ncbi:MAG: hypothetical protein ACOX85_12005 [Candidatus Pararuminococcus gallinarum]|jgi:hypothetical protein
MNAYIKKKNWLMSVALILFLLSVILIPFSVERTYAGRNEKPNHILTYTTGSLTWDNATDVDEKTGVAELSLFNSTYQNVQAENQDKVVAPGTEGSNIVRLKNDMDYSIEYIAVMYRMKEENSLPVEPVMADDESFTDTDTYLLPEGVTEEQVIRAVTGTVGANELQDFDITWLWQYYESDERDQIDTALGNKAAWEIPDEIQAGLYIIVVEDSGLGDPYTPDHDDLYTNPETHQTGDSNNFISYLILMLISGMLFLLLLLERRNGKPCKKP